jgi:hypothetical protein
MIFCLVKPYAPDLNKARILIREYANVKLTNVYIPALGQELTSLKTALDNVDSSFNISLSKMSSTLDTVEIVEYSKALKNTCGETATPYKTLLKRRLETVKSELQELANSMTSSLGGFETVHISDTSGELLTLDSERNKFLANLPADLKKLSGNREKLEILEKSIIEFESKTFIDRAQPIVKELEAAVTKTIDAPSENAKTAIKAGMTIAQNLLTIANETIKYNNLVEARDKLINENTILQSQMNYEQKQVNTIDDKKSQLAALQDVIEPRKLYVAEARKIIGMFVDFINDIFSTDSDLNTQEGLIAVADRFIESCPAVPSHFDSLAFYWLRNM